MKIILLFLCNLFVLICVSQSNKKVVKNNDTCKIKTVYSYGAERVPKEIISDSEWIETHYIESFNRDFSCNYDIDFVEYQYLKFTLKDYEKAIKNDSNFKEKSPFETSVQYENRIDAALKKNQNKYPINQLKNKLDSLEKNIYLKPSFRKVEFLINNYNADLNSWKLIIQDDSSIFEANIDISPTEAQKLWTNISSIRVYDLCYLFENPYKNQILIKYGEKNHFILLAKTPVGNITDTRIIRGNRRIIKQHKFESNLNKATIYAVIKVSPDGEGSFVAFDKGSTERTQAYANAISYYLKKIQFDKSLNDSNVTLEFIFDIK